MSQIAKRRGRPPSFNREAALDIATELFWRHGYDGASISRLTERMGITAPTLYAAFGSKAGLYQQVFARLREHRHQVAGGESARITPTLYQLLKRNLEEAAQQFADPAGPPGCMIAIGSLQCAPENRSARETAGSYRIADLKDFIGRIEAAKRTGEVPETCDAIALARFYAAVHQGMAVQAIDGATATELNAIVGIALAAWPK